MTTNRTGYRRGPELLSGYQAREDTPQLWMAVRDEWSVRSGKKGCDGWNIWLASDGTMHTHLSFFESRSLKVNKREAERLFALNGQELAIYITDEGEMERCFMDARHRAADVQVDGDVSIDFALQDLVEHFQIPEVPDVAECNPAGFEQHLQKLGELEELINIAVA